MSDDVGPLTPAMKAVLPLLPEAPHPGVTVADISPDTGYSVETVRMVLGMCRRAGLVERLGYQPTRSGPGGTYGIWRRIPADQVIPPQRHRLSAAMRQALEQLPIAPAPGVTVREVAGRSDYTVSTIRRVLNEALRMGLAEQPGSVHQGTGRSGPRKLWRRVP